MYHMDTFLGIKTSPVWSWQQAQSAKYFTLYSCSHYMYMQCLSSLKPHERAFKGFNVQYNMTA